MDRDSGELSISRERWYLEGAGGEGFSEGSMDLKLHARGFREVLRKGVNDGPIFRAQVERDEVSLAVVPRSTTRGNGRMCGVPRSWEVSSAGPPSGCFSKTEDLVQLWLVKQRYGRVESEEAKDAL